MSPDEERERIENEAVKETNVGNWEGARALFKRALTLDMPAANRAWILRNVAGTYFEEGNAPQTAATAEEALTILASVPDPVSSDAIALRTKLYDLRHMSDPTTLEAIKATQIRNWPRARALLEEALKAGGSALKRAWLLWNLALTHQSERKSRRAAIAAQKGIDVLDSVDIVSSEANELAKALRRIARVPTVTVTWLGASACVIGLVLWLNRNRIAAKPTDFGDIALRLRMLETFGICFTILGVLGLAFVLILWRERKSGIEFN